MKKLGFYAIVSFLLIACASKNKTHYTEIKVNDFPRTKSQSILRFSKNITIADTTVATISGKIYGNDYPDLEKFQQEDILPFTNISLTNTETKEVLGTTTNLDGAYDLSVPAATYQLKISFVTFNTIVLEDLQLGTGEVLKLSAHLGLGMDTEYFTILHHRGTRELIRKPD